MLQDKYLPDFHFSEKHSILIKKDSSEIWSTTDHMDFSGSWIIRTLFALRGMPARMTNRKGLQKGRFIRLEQKENEEIIIGLIGQFWKANGNLKQFDPTEFINWNQPDFLKATWNFELIPEGNFTRLETETRIQCLSKKSLSRFKRYWFFIRPFSGLIRKEILRGIKKKVESSGIA
ncbi:MAG TPA: hypothetical protein VIT44_11030 [Cyclobacteriaceae bacterium]